MAASDELNLPWVVDVHLKRRLFFCLLNLCMTNWFNLLSRLASYLMPSRSMAGILSSPLCELYEDREWHDGLRDVPCLEPDLQLVGYRIFPGVIVCCWDGILRGTYLPRADLNMICYGIRCFDRSLSWVGMTFGEAFLLLWLDLDALRTALLSDW